MARQENRLGFRGVPTLKVRFRSLFVGFHPSQLPCPESGWKHTDWGRIVFSEEFHFQLYPDDHRRRVWRRRGQRANPIFSIVSHTGPQPGVMVTSAISFDSQAPLGVIRGTLTAQRYVDDILRTILLPFLLQYPGLIFSKIMPDHIQHTCYYELSYNLSNTSLTSKIPRYLSNRACLGFEVKETASTGEC
ncbi:transposable element Tc1 transposase [Trichonephila clavipes]|uniref:Transposable element Tc1 transposase n=1 Tax=Trichonephila clavipes TaxID=2585209 RepID=A0A8X6V9N9_TRICX|nr:transposable element Tc1 transposase [Trichonephila clavipes]